MIKMPEYYEIGNNMPGDPEGSTVYLTRTNRAEVMALVYPIPEEHAMPFDNPQAVIDGIHNALAEDQGLIAVETGTTQLGNKYIYSIVKTLVQPSGVQYILTYNLLHNGETINLQGFFNEYQLTGERDSMVYALLSNKGEVGPGFEGWGKDPYDSSYTRGVLMNRSEDPAFDEMFPEHPLSIARELCSFIENNN